jgi:hypothetical protein
MGLETENIKNCDNNLIGIDTGIIIKFNDKSNHIILTDNSPYDLKIFKTFFKNIKTSSLFFPYNGFAQDYPLKYDNLSIESKRNISLKMALQREGYLLNFIKYLKPKILIPHSSDFILNTNRNLFYKIHPKDFVDKFLYAKRIENLTGVKSYALYAQDELKYINKRFFSVIKSNNISRTLKPKNIKLTFPEFKKINYKSNLDFLLKKSLNQLLIRLKKYKLIVPKNYFIILLKNTKKNYLINFKKKIIKKNVNLKHINLNKNPLILKINKNIFQAILERQIHINNAQIGCYLNWERYNNNFNKFRAIENAMNFFHI